MDGHVRAYKKLQVDNDLVVILISSLNRQNYCVIRKLKLCRYWILEFSLHKKIDIP